MALAVYIATEFSGTLSGDHETLELRWYRPGDFPQNINYNDRVVLTKFVETVVG